jgi:hypothetical protein
MLSRYDPKLKMTAGGEVPPPPLILGILFLPLSTFTLDSALAPLLDVLIHLLLLSD